MPLARDGLHDRASQTVAVSINSRASDADAMVATARAFQPVFDADRF